MAFLRHLETQSPAARYTSSMPSVLRIIDANANRAREALRVMEEAARFVLNDADLSGRIKGLRHDLAAAIARVPNLDAWRDTPGDVGTVIKTDSELTRSGVHAVVTANCKRLSEALRAIEEYGKTLPTRTGSKDDLAPEFSGLIESIRYRGYDVEQRLSKALATGRARQWKLCVLLSENLCPAGDWLTVAKKIVELGDWGPDCIQIREKAMDAGELLNRTRKLVELCRPRGIAVIVNDRPDVALLAEADGVHLGQTDLPPAEARKLVGSQLIIGISTSCIEEARRAAHDGADYCGVGPMFPTTTKRKDTIVGPAYLAQYVAEFPDTPHLAIAGIKTGNLPELIKVGCRGIAVSSAVCSAGDPAAACAGLRALLGER